MFVVAFKTKTVKTMDLSKLKTMKTTVVAKNIFHQMVSDYCFSNGKLVQTERI